MTTQHYGRAPGDIATHAEVPAHAPGGLLVYTIGLALAVVLSAMSVLGNYLDGRI